MALLIIQQDCSTHEARDWLAELMNDVLDRLDMEQCVALISGDGIAANIVNQIGYLTPNEIDGLFERATESLLE